MVFLFPTRIRSHIDGCPIRGLMPLVFCYVYVCKMEGDIVVLIKKFLYKECLVTDT